MSYYTKELVKNLVQIQEAEQHRFVLFFNGAQLRAQPEWLQQFQNEVNNERVEWRVRTMSNKLLKVTELLFSRPSTGWMFGDVDVILLPTVDFFPRWSATQPPVVVTIHDLSFERYPDCLSLRRKWWHRLLRPRALARRAATCITVSEHTARDLQQLYGVAPERIATIHPGVPRPVQGKSSIVLPKGQRYILSLSTLEPRKNIMALVEAFEQLQHNHPDVHLIVAGGSGWHSGDLRRELQSRKNVQYLGYVDEPTKQYLLEGAELFVYPSLYEGFGFPPLEAQRAGTPVVVGSHSSLPEVCGDSALLVDVLDVDSLQRAMHHVLTDAELRERLVQAGKENVRRFDWETAARTTLATMEAAQ